MSSIPGSGTEDEPEEPASREDTGAGHTTNLRIAAAIALLAIAARVWMACSTHSTTEDFYITLRYSQNIAAGHGFVYNPGARVLGTTTPLYTLVLALFAALHVNPVLAGKALNIAADGATCFLLAYLPSRREFGLPQVGQFAAALYAFSSTPISIAIGGMETGLVTCVCAAMVAVYAARRSLPLYTLGAILLLLRVDGLALFALLPTGLAVQQRRIPWRHLAICALLLTPWLAFALVYFGSPVPTSLTAKLFVYSHAMATPRAVTIAAFQTQFFGGIVQKTLTALFLVGLASLIPLPGAVWKRFTAPKRVRAALAAPALWLLIYYATMFQSRVPPFAWYFLPPWPLYLLIAALGAQRLLAIPTFDRGAFDISGQAARGRGCTGLHSRRGPPPDRSGA